MHPIRNGVGELIQVLIGHLNDVTVGFDSAKRIVLGGNARLGQRVEQRGFADVREPDDAAWDSHDGRMPFW